MGRPAHHTSPLSKDIQKQPHIPRNVALLHQSTTTPTTTPNNYPHRQEPNSTPTITDAQADQFTQMYSSESERLATSIQGRREDELPGYTQDEIAFLNDVLKKTKIRPDNMIELPLPFIESDPKFPFNRTTAKQRTTTTLERMRKKEPEYFLKNLEKFAQNTNRDHPRFEGVPPNQNLTMTGPPTGSRSSQ